MTLIPNDYQKGINEAFEISKKEIDTLKAENKKQMTNYKATCAVTGKTENLTMHAFRNDKGEMIGWVFLSDEISNKIDEFNIEIKTEWKTETKTQPIIGYQKNRIDNL